MVFSVHDGATARWRWPTLTALSPNFWLPRIGLRLHGQAKSAERSRRVFWSRQRLSTALGGTAGRQTDRSERPDIPIAMCRSSRRMARPIVFIRRDGDIYRVDADGKNLSRLTEGNRHVEFQLSDKDRHGSTDGPDISPDGKQIAFIAVADGIPNVFAMDMDGTNRRQVTKRKSACGQVLESRRQADRFRIIREEVPATVR